MLVLPMSSPTSSPNRQRDSSPYTPRTQREESPQTAELRRKVADTMLSVMPPTSSLSSSASNHKRPKLSLQTSPASSLPPSRRPSLQFGDKDSPTTRNTRANAQEAPPPTPSSAIQPRIAFPSIPNPAGQNTLSSPPSTTPTQKHQSPFIRDEPYAIPLGTHSILRNSPLPKRHLSATSTRPPTKRMFPHSKTVAFSDRPVDLAPTPIFEQEEEEEGEEENEDDGEEIERQQRREKNDGEAPQEGGDAPPLTEEERREERRRTIQEEDGHAAPATKGQQRQRRKKRREWIWRPVEDDDVLLSEYHQRAQQEGKENEERGEGE